MNIVNTRQLKDILTIRPMQCPSCQHCCLNAIICEIFSFTIPRDLLLWIVLLKILFFLFIIICLKDII